MKNKHTYITLILTLFFCLSGWSQFQNLGPLQLNSNGVPIAGFPGDPIGGGSDGGVEPNTDFNFTLTFNDINILRNLEIEIERARRAAVNTWLRAQEETFRKEINRQFGTNHGNFKDAQRTFFRNFEKNFRGVDQTATQIASGDRSRSRRLNKEQEDFTQELFLLNRWNNGQCSGNTCATIGEQRVRGITLENASTSTLRNLYDQVLRDFSNREFNSALNVSWANGLSNLVSDGTFLDMFSQMYIDHYNRIRDIEDRVFLMSAYLIQYNNRSSGPLPLPIPAGVRLPHPFWNSNILRTMGRDNARPIPLDAKLFLPNFINDRISDCIDAARAQDDEFDLPYDPEQQCLEEEERLERTGIY